MRFSKITTRSRAKTREEIIREDESRLTRLSEVPVDEEVGAYLKKVPILSKLKEEERGKLGSLLRKVNFAEGEFIIKQGTLATHFYLLKSGTAQVLLEDLDTQQESVVADLHEGDYFGEQALLNESKRTATVIATTECVCLVLSKSKFDSVFNKEKLNVKFAKRNAISAEKMRKLYLDELKVDESATRKTAEQTKHLSDKLAEHILFQSIEDKDRNDIVNMMWRQDVSKGTKIITQGSRGHHFYFIESGEFEVFIKYDDPTIDDANNVNEIKVNHLSRDDVFGELALMYNSPRAATVIAAEDSVVWVVDRFTFRRALKFTSKAKLDKYSQFLGQVPVLSSLLTSERFKIVEAMEEVTFKDGETIISEGEEGEDFFMITEGQVGVWKNDGATSSSEFVSKLSKGDFFGERALIMNEPRAATIKAIGYVHALTLNRSGFNLLLGSLQEIMHERVEGYDNIQGRVNRASSSVDAQSARLPVAFEDLQVLGNLGKGSFGLVQMVRDGKSKKCFALKRLDKASLVQMDQTAHVMNEKIVMSSLCHPFIVKLRNTYQDSNSLYFLMDVCLGGDLFSLLRSQTLFEEKVARFYAASIILAFEHMHQRDIIHRDLKPENVLVEKDGYIKLTDFGFAKIVEERTWTLCGTPDYLAPEMITGQGHGKGVDWWTLGILIYEMIASYPPFYDDDPMLTYARIARGKISFPKHFSKAAIDLVKRLLHPKPSKRLGVVKGGAEFVKSHPWFKGFDWDALVTKKLPAPFVPDLEGDDDMAFFDGSSIDDTVEQFDGVECAWCRDF